MPPWIDAQCVGLGFIVVIKALDHVHSASFTNCQLGFSVFGDFNHEHSKSQILHCSVQPFVIFSAGIPSNYFKKCSSVNDDRDFAGAESVSAAPESVRHV
jgi:hypothetical protein